jgi:hypothetical protein
MTYKYAGSTGEDNAYGVTIRDWLEAQISRTVTLGGIYKTLVRLDGKGLLTVSVAPPTSAAFVRLIVEMDTQCDRPFNTLAIYNKPSVTSPVTTPVFGGECGVCSVVVIPHVLHALHSPTRGDRDDRSE